MNYSLGIAILAGILVGVNSYVDRIDNSASRRPFYLLGSALIVLVALALHKSILGYWIPIPYLLIALAAQLLTSAACKLTFNRQ